MNLGAARHQRHRLFRLARKFPFDLRLLRARELLDQVRLPLKHRRLRAAGGSPRPASPGPLRLLARVADTRRFHRQRKVLLGTPSSIYRKLAPLAGRRDDQRDQRPRFGNVGVGCQISSVTKGMKDAAAAA
jgi:hypothetical protein